MLRYRLYTEDKGNITGLTAGHFGNFTIYKALGYWTGHIEDTSVIEILNETSIDDKIKRLAQDIKEANKQDCVLITCESVEAYFV